MIAMFYCSDLAVLFNWRSLLPSSECFVIVFYSILNAAIKDTYYFCLQILATAVEIISFQACLQRVYG